MVSTDDTEIAAISEVYGAEVPFLRSETNSNDYATTLDVIREVLEQYKSAGRTFEEVCCIYATAPLIRNIDLVRGLNMLQGDVASVFPVTPFSFPILRSLKVDKDQRVSMNWPEYSQTRSQDLPAAYHDAGQWYWLKPNLIGDSLYTDTSKVLVLRDVDAQDIDNDTDWAIAEIKYKLRKKSVVVRADGSARMGMGHLYRSLALTELMGSETEIFLVSKNDIPVGIQLPGTNRFQFIKIEDESQFVQMCSSECIVIIDGHHFDAELYRQVKVKGSQLICIDDLHDKKYEADIIINQAVGITPADYKASPWTYYALGPEYALLRKPFLEAAKQKRIRTSVRSCFICFGGGDVRNLTKVALEVALTFGELERIYVVTGGAYPYSKELDESIALESRVVHLHDATEDEMVDVMTQADVAIIPCSTILLEVFAVGCIPIAGHYVENQKYFYHNFLEQQAFIDAISFSEHEIRAALHKAIDGKIQLTTIIDGQSTERLKALFKLLDARDRIQLRLATSEDVDTTFRWASDARVRQYSFQKGEIVYAEHRAWFMKKIADAACKYYMIAYEGHDIGSIRFDKEQENAVISYLLDPAFHGQGLGQALLIEGCKAYTREVLVRPLNIVGYVTPENVASMKIFEHLGFVRVDLEDRIKYLWICK